VSKLKAVFLDRDGTINKAIQRPNFGKKITAPFSLEELEFTPHLDEAIRMFRQLNYLVIIITNQPDVAYGYISQEDWQKIHNEILYRVKPNSCFMCRHRREDGCPMRKPSPMMILAAADSWGIDLKKSFMIGDTEVDMMAGKSAGCRRLLVDTPYNAGVESDDLVLDLKEAAWWISATDRLDQME